MYYYLKFLLLLFLFSQRIISNKLCYDLDLFFLSHLLVAGCNIGVYRTACSRVRYRSLTFSLFTHPSVHASVNNSHSLSTHHNPVPFTYIFRSTDFVSSPELLGSQGDFIVYPSSQLPTVCPASVRHPSSSTIFTDLL